MRAISEELMFESLLWTNPSRWLIAEHLLQQVNESIQPRRELQIIEVDSSTSLDMYVIASEWDIKSLLMSLYSLHSRHDKCHLKS